MLEAAVLCLAMNVYHEARGEGIQAMMAVAEVTMNRVDDSRYPNNVCDVVKQGYNPKTKHTCHFSWYCDGESDKMYDKQMSFVANEIAVDYLTGLTTNFTNGATHYHATYVNPYWSKQLTKTTTIGSHIFYRWD